MSTKESRQETDRVMRHFEQQVSDFARDTWIAMMQDPSHRRRYFYFIRSSGPTAGSLHAVLESTDPPSGAELATAESIPAGTQQQIRAWTRAIAYQLPVLPTGTR